ncbi:hypothetical protein C1H46_043978 [Malus baccata]|uniref:Uncharacterized protein n=1 Tax=Malus baccata TaxID=106549 RepID=A0A540K980_MALBA|nr:hypothetical protein C1H46_043978 [Malus baccata]
MLIHSIGFNGGVPITEEFFSEKITGGHNEYICGILFPDWDIERARQFFQDKESMYRRLVSEKVEPVKGLDRLRQRIEKQGLRRAAVTNASRLNVELILSKLKLTDFFEILVLRGECVRAKPFPDPYLTAPETLKLSNKHVSSLRSESWSISRNAGSGFRHKESRGSVD